MNETRRSFLYLASLHALAAPALAKALDHNNTIQAQAAPPAQPFYSVPAARTEGLIADLKGKKGGTSLVDGPGLPLVRITSEQSAAAKEFEYHEHTTHIFEVLDGHTRFDIGGTPDAPHKVKEGEWLSPSVTGSSVVEMSKGDMLVIPHGTPHKRTTEGQAVLKMISITS